MSLISAELFYFLRLPQHRNAYAIALFLENHAAVARVLYPGLPSHPQHEIAKKQQHGFGAMITFYCKGSLKQASLILENVCRVESIFIFTLFGFICLFSHLISVS